MPSILVFVAHSDDQILGSGGVMAKYAKKGYDIHTVICSYGEKSHPHLQKSVISKMRDEESEKANKVIGGKKVLFLGVEEGQFMRDYKEFQLKRKMLDVIKKIKPRKIFTHAENDGHPDHRATNTMLLDIVDSLEKKPEVYAFHVWKLFNMRKKKYPKVIYDISKVFHIKMKALQEFKSQINPLSYAQFTNVVYLTMYWKAFLAGRSIGTKYGEVFYKIR